jgi:superfamily I DNA and/or RNA helicase
MTHTLVRHIVRHGAYSSNDITVLTPYVGQLQKLRAAMRQEFEIERDQDTLVKDGFVYETPSKGVGSGQAVGPVFQKKAMTELLRVGTVDNFQGEEAKVVIVSLVRSNTEKKLDFKDHQSNQRSLEPSSTWCVSDRK